MDWGGLDGAGVVPEKESEVSVGLLRSVPLLAQRAGWDRRLPTEKGADAEPKIDDGIH